MGIARTCWGKVPNSELESPLRNIVVGDIRVSLHVEHTFLRAYTLIAENGKEVDRVERVFLAKDCPCEVFSEKREVFARGNEVWYHSRAGGFVFMPDDVVIPLYLTINGLSWIKLKALTDQNRLDSLCLRAGPMETLPPLDIPCPPNRAGFWSDSTHLSAAYSRRQSFIRDARSPTRRMRSGP